jgi:hypothetical protein
MRISDLHSLAREDPYADHPIITKNGPDLQEYSYYQLSAPRFVSNEPPEDLETSSLLRVIASV